MNGSSLRSRGRTRQGALRRRGCEALEDRRLLYDSSPAPILQWFESSYDTVEERAADLFRAGYGAVWLPPPSRADISNFSVGYDVYDRFDLGSPGNSTLYGTETGIRTLADEVHRAGLDLHVDFVLNHNGYSGTNSSEDRQAFKNAGGYPGFFLEFFGDVDGDFNSAYSYGDVQGRLAGLIDIDHDKNYRAVRNPVPGFANNIAAGTTPHNGRLANVPSENNRRFYPDIGHDTIFVFDPVTGEQNIPVHSFDLQNPLDGDPTEENALGYIMRNAQWLVQAIGVDGLRIDAAKHVDGFVLDYIDRAVYRTNPRDLLDGSPRHVFSYSEVYDASPAVLLPHVKKTINPADPGRIGGNRDTLDFKLYFALKENLESAGQSNAWFNIRNASLDFANDGLHNGSHGVKFVHNHDVFKPYALDSVAHAYVLMMPGNAEVYFNGKEFGDNRDFPKDGRSDALSVGNAGALNSQIAKLVEIRNSHGRGNYAERWIDNQGLFAFERVSSSLVMLSNRGDAGFDSRTFTNMGFAPGTQLVELTGNAANPAFDPFNEIPEVLTVFEEGGVNKVNARFLRNSSFTKDGNGNINGQFFHGNGYLVYGLATPQAPNGLQLTNVASVLAGDETPTNNYENGSQRQTDVKVITANSFEAKLQTVEVNLLGSIRDIYADGDAALLRVDGGVDLNGNGVVDVRTPGDISYAFENFGTKNSPLIGNHNIGSPRGDGEFRQIINATQLSEGYHYLTARAYRHRTDGGPPVYSDFKEVVYIDRLPPNSGIASFDPFNAGQNENRDLVIRSLDKTANNVHVFLNLPASMTRDQILAQVNAGNKAGEIDRDLFKYGYFGVQHGNNVATVVTYEATGNVNVQRIPGLFTSTIIGAGLGDCNFDGQYSPTDVDVFRSVLLANNTQFNSAGDLNADGLVNYADLNLFQARLNSVSANAATMNALHQLQGDVFGAVTDTFNIHEDQQLGVLPSGVLGNDHATLPEIHLSVMNAGSFTSNLGAAVSLFSDGGFTYNPLSVALLQALAVGQTVNDFFSYTLSDGLGHTTQGRVDLFVSGRNDLPTITSINDQAGAIGAPLGPLAFTLGDRETAANSLTVTAQTNNAALTPPGSIVFDGSGANRTVTVNPAAGVSGVATITVNVFDGVDTVGEVFRVSVGNVVSWRNSSLPEDINGSGAVSNADVFILVAELRATPGGRDLPVPPMAPNLPPPYLDPSGNNRLDNTDIFLVVAYIRNHPPAGEGEGEAIAVERPLRVGSHERVASSFPTLPAEPSSVAAWAIESEPALEWPLPTSDISPLEIDFLLLATDTQELNDLLDDLALHWAALDRVP